MKIANACLIISGLLLASVAAAETTISPTRKFAWGENIGWTNWRDANVNAATLDERQGARIYRTIMGGFVWGENVGWINLGNPANAVSGSYANTTGLNHGVNIDTNTGVLSGFAWGENIGWINFNTVPTQGAQGARYDRITGRLSGYVWGENIGWINLDDANHYICGFSADLNGDGVVTTPDLTRFLGSFGAALGQGARGDLNADGAINTADLTIFLGQFSRGCL
ncbi:MAG: GC-type dockerin domain-anchored protein [Phycisphaerales bacterium]